VIKFVVRPLLHAIAQGTSDDAMSTVLFEETAPEKSYYGARISNKGASGKKWCDNQSSFPTYSDLDL
jgi:hypothetical protein